MLGQALPGVILEARMEEFQIDRYRVTGSLGAGANGRVYLGLDPKLDREVAIKVVHPELAADDEVMSRFHREARAIARLHHPNILEIYDYSGAESALAYLVVERLHGRTLEELIVQGGPLDVGTAAAAVHEICLALSHAHGIGIVHRDLKPENVFLEPSGRVVLCDFGIARSFDKKERGTLAGRETEMLGTPLFMSPEQITDPGNVSAPSDLFSLGGMLYHLVTGEFAFRATSIIDVLQKIVIADYTPLAEAGIDADYSEVVDRCLKVEPGDRFGSADEVARALLGIMKARGFTDPRAALAAVVGRVQTQVRRVTPLDRNDEVSRTIIHTATSHSTQASTRITVHAGEQLTKTPQHTRAAGAQTADARPRRRRPWRVWLAAGAAVVTVVAIVAWATLAPRPQRPTNAITIDAVTAPVVEAPPVPVDPPPEPQPIDPPAVPSEVAAPERAPDPEHDRASKPPRAAKVPETASGKREQRPAPEPPRAVAGGPGVLRIVALPWADVYIDERKVGTTPIFRTTPLSAGKHTVRLVNPAFSTLVRHFEIAPGQALDLKFDLAKGR